MGSQMGSHMGLCAQIELLHIHNHCEQLTMGQHGTPHQCHMGPHFFFFFFQMSPIYKHCLGFWLFSPVNSPGTYKYIVIKLHLCRGGTGSGSSPRVNQKPMWPHYNVSYSWGTAFKTKYSAWNGNMSIWKSSRKVWRKSYFCFSGNMFYYLRVWRVIYCTLEVYSDLHAKLRIHFLTGQTEVGQDVGDSLLHCWTLLNSEILK